MKRYVKLAALCLVMTMLAALFCVPAQALDTASGAQHITGNGSIGQGIGKQTTLVDFTSSDLCGFEAVGNIAEPTFQSSSAWNANVLYTWIDSANAETGIRGTLAKASQLQNASTLSVQLLAQYTKSTDYRVTLKLESVDKNGAPLSLEAHTTASATNWQTATFDISAFVARVNPDAACTVTILTSSNAAESEQLVLWVRSLYTCSLNTYPEILLPVAAAVCGFLLGFILFYVIYRATCKKNRRPRWQEEF